MSKPSCPQISSNGTWPISTRSYPGGSLAMQPRMTTGDGSELLSLILVSSTSHTPQLPCKQPVCMETPAREATCQEASFEQHQALVWLSMAK